jgi:hypothetical protein
MSPNFSSEDPNQTQNQQPESAPDQSPTKGFSRRRFMGTGASMAAIAAAFGAGTETAAAQPYLGFIKKKPSSRHLRRLRNKLHRQLRSFLGLRTAKPARASVQK